MMRTPKLMRTNCDAFAQWRLDWGWMAIYCCCITEAKRIAERIRWCVRTGMRPTFDGYQDCRCGRKREWPA